MALATKCDVCGVLFEQKFIPDITIHKYTHGYGEERLDLCPDCSNKLETWLHNEKCKIDFMIEKGEANATD